MGNKAMSGSVLVGSLYIVVLGQESKEGSVTVSTVNYFRMEYQQIKP